MKPITTTNPEGRALLALRAGPMTTSEINERLNGSLPGWLVKEGLVVIADSHYRLTDAGRAACPYRNPLAAPGLVQAATFKPEIEMSKQTVVTRQQVLAVITEAGPAGIRKNNLVGSFPMVHENAITSHLVMLKKDGAINNPSLGVWVATSTVNPKNEPKTESPAITPSPETPAKIALKSPLTVGSAAQPIAPAMIDELADLITEASHAAPIEISAVPDRRAPVKIDVDADDLEISIFTDGSMDFLVDDGLDDAHIKLTDAAVKKLRRFLGLFQEAA